MVFEKYRSYKPLLGDNEDQSDAEDSTASNVQRLKQDSWLWRIVRVVHPLVTAVLLIVVAIGLYREKKLFHSRCVRELHTPSPIIKAGVIDKYDTVYFNGTINFKEKWAGPPNDDRDKMWHSMVYDVWIPITDEDVTNMGKDPKSVTRVPPQYRKDYGDGAIVVMEFAHQMHCLDLVRKYTYYDYYMEKQDEEAFGNPPHVLRVHIDHCIDMLRQFVMCNADPGLVTYFWVDGRPTPYPDFSMQKQCKNPYALLEWAREKRIPDYKPVYPSPGEAVFPWDPQIL
ncbi:hypothetical protein BX600DRAFT_510744 [Xylariales sp. PMI_506]|nr:hypothetical protein BX600DRAFT_510744 [Xylariales sp. PMI_506]